MGQQAVEKVRQRRSRALRGSTYGKEYASPLCLLRPCWTAFLNSLRWILNESVGIQALRFCLAQVVYRRSARWILSRGTAICESAAALNGLLQALDPVLEIDP